MPGYQVPRASGYDSSGVFSNAGFLFSRRNNIREVFSMLVASFLLLGSLLRPKGTYIKNKESLPSKIRPLSGAMGLKTVLVEMERSW